ncbi:hypothetical protein LXL04_016132 [Taraxacum kok-saghyz]
MKELEADSGQRVVAGCRRSPRYNENDDGGEVPCYRGWKGEKRERLDLLCARKEQAGSPMEKGQARRQPSNSNASCFGDLQESTEKEERGSDF